MTTPLPESALGPGVVRDALYALCYAKSLADSPLLDLALVSRGLRSEGLADSLESRTWVLSRLLHDEVTAQLDRLRGSDSPTSWRDLSPGEAVQGLADDFAAGSTEREAWGAVYFRYVAGVDQPVQRAVDAGIPQRTLLRRAKRGAERLALRLREREQEAATGAMVDALPDHPTRLIGRSADLALAAEQLGRTRLLTLTGPGGTGKTRLAIELARTVGARHPDGARFVDLSPLDDPALVDAAVASALGVRDAPDQPIRDRLLDHLAERSTLLILDNCEHVLAAAADLAEGIVGRAGEAQVVATSREPLRIAGERVIGVPPLGLPDPATATAPEHARRSAAVELFVERAEAASASFELTSDNAEAVAKLCLRLDGIPLALELAAARARVLPPEAMLARLDQRFALLANGRRTASARQRTLEGAIDWSYALLDPAERRVFQRLAVFRGGWTIGAAEAVCAGDGIARAEVLDLLGHLVEKSLVVALAAGGRARFRFLESIHAYARLRSKEAGEAAAAQRRHLAHFVGVAEQAGAAMRSEEHEAWIARLEADHDNLRAAIAHAEALADAEAARRLGIGLGFSFYARGRLVEGGELMRRLLAVPGVADRSADHAALLNLVGVLANHRGAFAEARTALGECLAIREALGNTRGMASALTNLGIEALLRKDLDAAEAHFGRARELGGDSMALLANHGLVALRRGAFDVARERYEASLGLARDAGDTWSIGHALANLGSIAYRQGELDRSVALLEEALAIKRRIGDGSTIPYLLTSLGEIEAARGKLPLAIERLAEAIPMALALGDRASLVGAGLGLATVAQRAGAPLVAARLLAAADAGREALGIQLTDLDRADLAAVIPLVRAAIGEAAFETAWALGRSDSLEAATRMGLDALAAASTADRTAPGPP